MANALDVGMKALATLVALVLAALILSHGRRRASLALGAFLLLLAGNQGAETARAFVDDPALKLLWFRVATVFAALDPVALLWFGSVAPERNRLHRAAVLAPAAVVGLALAAAAPLYLPFESLEPRSVALNAALALFTAAAYGLAFLEALRRALGEPDASDQRSLALALAIAALPAASRVAHSGVYALLLAGVEDAPALPLARVVAQLGLALLAAALLARLAWGARAWTRDARAAAWTIVGGGVAVTVLVLVPPFVNAGTLVGWWPSLENGEVLVRVTASARWMLFGLLATVSLVRHDVLGMGVRGRRRSARILVGLAVVLAASFTLAVVQVSRNGAVSMGPEWLLLAIVLAASQGIHRLVDHAAWRIYGVPLPQDAAGREATYRRASEAAHLDGRPEAFERLRALRDDLGLDDASARALDALAEGSVRVPLREGRMVERRYLVGPLLGRGGHGRIHLARDTALGRDVVLKELPAGVGAAAMREARAAAALAHPHVVAVHDVLVREDRALIVAEHCSGGTLAERVESQGPLPRKEALDVLDQVLQSLAAAHARGIVHEDVKPSNLLFDAAGRVKLADFGLASLAGDVTLGPAQLAPRGSARWAAPEQRRGERATPATDVHAVGLLARWLAPELPARVEEVVARALAPEPGARWRDAGEMLAALRAARQDQ